MADAPTYARRVSRIIRFRHLRRWPATLVAVLLVAGACSGDGAEPTTTSTTAPAPTTTAVPATTVAPREAPAAPSPTVDRLVIVSLDGEVVSMDRSGNNVLVHSEAGEIPFQPIFDPVGDRIGYSLVAPTPALVIAAGDGSSREVTDLTTNPFYLYWSHDGTRLASLRNGPIGLEFEVFDTTGPAPMVEFTDTGAPYYFDWSPEGRDLVAHVGTNRLDLLTADGYEDIGPEPGLFSAPQWLSDGVLAPITRDSTQELVFVSGDGSVQTVLALEGNALFELESSSQRLLAIQMLTDTGDAVEAALQIAEALPANELAVVNLSTGDVESVHDSPVAAFFWSPYGERLLFLTSTATAGVLQWQVWEDGAVTPGPEFAPFRQWLGQFIPFFEQYSRSMSLWAPDATAYSFPGAIDDERGVWVVDIATGEIDLIAEGVWVSWSQN